MIGFLILISDFILIQCYGMRCEQIGLLNPIRGMLMTGMFELIFEIVGVKIYLRKIEIDEENSK